MMPGQILRRLDRIDRMFNVRDDVMVVATNTATAVSLSILGSPIPQPHMKCYYSRVLSRLIVYDPTKDEKLAFKRIVRVALAEMGATFPLFENGVKLKVTATFHVVDTRKDIDNLLKFLLDALAPVMYNNDNVIYSVVAKKVSTTPPDVEYTEFVVENIVDGEN